MKSIRIGSIIKYKGNTLRVIDIQVRPFETIFADTWITYIVEETGKIVNNTFETMKTWDAGEVEVVNEHLNV